MRSQIRDSSQQWRDTATSANSPPWRGSFLEGAKSRRPRLSQWLEDAASGSSAPCPGTQGLAVAQPPLPEYPPPLASWDRQGGGLCAPSDCGKAGSAQPAQDKWPCSAWLPTTSVLSLSVLLPTQGQRLTGQWFGRVTGSGMTFIRKAHAHGRFQFGGHHGDEGHRPPRVGEH